MRSARVRPDKELDAQEAEEQTFKLAAAVVRLANDVKDRLPPTLIDRLVDAGTTVGVETANALATSGRRVHISSLTMARKASQELDFWLKIVAEVDESAAQAAEGLIDDAHLVYHLLSSMRAKARQNLEQDNVT
ncbi:MAG: four helix bundle protein [bacterium]|nr:four helix bundle protein [bacterium]